MKLLLIHLSDIHFQSANDVLLGRVESIAAAIRSCSTDADVLACAVTGDIAYAGLPTQYELARNFFRLIEENLQDVLRRRRLHWVITPGNHDCHHRNEDASLRNLVVDAVRNDPSRAFDPAIVRVCTATQDNFFAFLEEFAPSHDEHFSRLAYDYKIDTSSSMPAVLFRCFNTAWISTNPEQPGVLSYPPPSDLPSAPFVISLLHHPINWLAPENARSFSKAIEACSDLVLTGHEHDPGQYMKSRAVGSALEFIEGAVLQDSRDPGRSGFNVLHFDFEGELRTLRAFAWDGKRYVAGEPVSAAICRNSALRRREFEFTTDFAGWLEDPGVALTHPSKNKLTLDDIFVWPDIREVAYSKKEKLTVRGERMFDRILEEKLVILTAVERGGKTALAKQFVRSFRQRGVIPVYLSCRDCKVSPDNVEKCLRRGVAAQYGEAWVEAFEQLPAERRVIIVDDIDRLTLGRSSKVELLQRLAQFAGYVVVFANEFTRQIEDVVYSRDGLVVEFDFQPYRIQEFGHALRYALAQRWFGIGLNLAAANERLEQQWSRARRIMDTVVGKNFIPAIPVFLLSILQTLEADRPFDTNASTYGYFYEMFIREALVGFAREFDPNTTSTYLSYMAWDMFSANSFTLSDQAMRTVHATYEGEMDLKLSYRRLMDAFVKARILEYRDDDFCFKYRYTYYYFVASYLRDRLAVSDIRETVRQMAGSLYVEDHAHILLFVAHLTRDPYVISTLLTEARRIYEEFEPARLERDVDFVNASSTEFELKYVDGDVTVSRRRLLSQLDELESEVDMGELVPEVSSDDDDNNDDALLDPVIRLNTAFKTMQIIGQILKNFTGAINGELKTEMASECYRLGLRSLAAVLQLMRNHEETVIAVIFDILKREHPRTSDDDLFERAKSAVYDLAQIMAYGIVKRIAWALGSERLTLTYANVLKSNETNAVLLVDVALKLDHTASLPENDLFRLKRRYASNPLADSLLRHLVVHHFYLFDVHYMVKQRVCEKLKIPYERVVTTDRREKLVVKGQTPALLGPAPPRARQ